MGDYLRISTVQVVQAIDLAELDKTIKWLVSKVQELPTADQANQRTIADSLLQDQIDALRRENGSLKDALAQLQSKQDDMESRLDTKQDRDQTPAESSGADVGDSGDIGVGASEAATNDPIVALERRLVAVEQRVEQLPTTSADEADAADAAASGPDLNSQFQELLAGHRALAATVSGLQHELESKPNRAEMDLKANRSELDALLRAGVSMAPVGDAPLPILSVKSDGSVDNKALVEAVNKAAAEVAAMRGQVAVVQDRLQGKAEQGGVDDLASQLAALKSRHSSNTKPASSGGAAAGDEVAASATPGLESAIGAAEGLSSIPSLLALESSPALESISKRLDNLELRVSAGAPMAIGSGEHAVDDIGTLNDVQPLLKDIYARLDSKADRLALEDALRRLHELAASMDQKADTATLKDSATRLERMISTKLEAHADKTGQRKQDTQWIVSHELGEGVGPWSAAFERLNAQVSELAARVAKLPESWPPGLPLARKSSMGVDGLDMSSIQGALAALHGQLGELGTRLAGKADAGDVARLELALNSKADVDELAEIRLALGSKADAADLGDLQVAVAGKADQAALDEVKLTAALAADLASGANGDLNADGTTRGGGYTNLLGAIQGMVADKANKAELGVLQNQLMGKASAEDVGLLRAAVEDKASAAELSALMSQFSGRLANSEEIMSLDQRMGDVFAELAKIRADMAALPVDALAAGTASPAVARDGGDPGGLQRIVSVLNREVGMLREGLDTVAHAANVLAVGLDHGARMSATGAVTGGVEGRYSDAEGAGGKEHRSPRGGYERLLKLLGSGDYRHKMEAFDPVALQQMAQKLAYLEATVKSPAMGRAGLAGVDYGIKELERQVKRLNIDVRLMKDKIIEPSSSLAISGSRISPGDHAMLAARPITGYRCMACDRPLDQLDVSPGPHIPTQQLPVRVPAATDTTSRTQVRSGRGDPLSPQASSQRVAYGNDPNGRNGQNWYKDAPSVIAAEALPRDYVGPHLPPGGWRPSNPGATNAKQPAMQGSLPALSAPKTRPQPAGVDYEQKGQPIPTPPMEGAAANVMLPQIS